MNFKRFQKEPRLKTQAYQLRERGDYTQAAEAFAAYLKTHPKDLVAWIDLGHCLMQLERFEDATKAFAKVLEFEPRHVIALSNLGGALYRAGKPHDAKVILQYAIELDPKCLYAYVNLGGVFQALGDLQGNLDSALKAVSIEPTSALAFNNLGSALSELAMFKEAKHAYETAAILEPNQIDTLINLAALEARLGSPENSVKMYEKTISLIPEREKQRADAIRFFCSFEYLKMGNLSKGWDYYEGGFSPMVPLTGARSPKRNFSVPQWRGESLKKKRLLVWREQGLGDELLFGSCLPELESLDSEAIILETDKRLVDIFSRSFPNFFVREQSFLISTGRPAICDFDYHIPLGSLMRIFRPTIESFSRSKPYLIPSDTLMADFTKRLKPYRDRPLVGICWRSGKLSPVRNLSYSALEDWLPMLKSDKLHVVSLQYGDCESEIQEVEKSHGVKIIRWDDLDQKNQLDRVFSLIACLDLVISVNTAPLRMAASIGAPVLTVQGKSWTMMGSDSDRSLWFKNNIVLAPMHGSRFSERIPDLCSIAEGLTDLNAATDCVEIPNPPRL
ncbi:MAG: tetratricopeptide repeat protein [Betaproteobacteria bacterium]|nr:tetratricopeptide repeat protein [Betaproteobacteria bacterium]